MGQTVQNADVCKKMVNLELIATDRKHSHCFRLGKLSLATYQKSQKVPAGSCLKTGFLERRGVF